MALYLILTSEIAGEVREQLASAVPVYVSIERVGAFILPASVLQAEVHASTWPILETCTQLALDDPDFPPAIEPEE